MSDPMPRDRGMIKVCQCDADQRDETLVGDEVRYCRRCDGVIPGPGGYISVKRSDIGIGPVDPTAPVTWGPTGRIGPSGILDEHSVMVAEGERSEPVEVETAELPSVTSIPQLLPTQVRRLADLLAGGMDLDRAATRVGLGGLRGNQRLRQEVLRIVSEYYLPAVAQRELVRAARLRVLMDALQDGSDPALTLRAAREIASDPEVGLTAPPSPLVSIEISEDLARVLEKIDAEESTSSEQ
jgi:hypothetical protein